jgi:hypothetical protein
VIEIPLPRVERVPTEHGTRVEPPLDTALPDHEQVAWVAAVAALDTGLRIRVWVTGQSRRPYGFNIGRHSVGNYDFYQAQTYLSGVTTGAQAHATQEVSA